MKIENKTLKIEGGGDHSQSFVFFHVLDFDIWCIEMSEKLCLQWNDFQDNIKSVFGNLREDNDFADVTLVCEDGHQVEAHKVILAASSPFFQNLFTRNSHTHPLIFMRGVKSDILLAVVDFLYCGKANVLQQNLDSFLVLAEELQLKGLVGKINLQNCNFDLDEKGLTQKHIFETNARKVAKAQDHDALTSRSKVPRVKENEAIAAPENPFGDLDKLDERVNSMMEKSQSNYKDTKQKASICKVCGKEGLPWNIKYHIEANHLDGIALPCNQCNMTFR